MTVDFAVLAQFLKNSSGLVIAADKLYLVESRLNPVVAKHGCASLADLVNRLKAFPGEELKRDVIEAMTTNETSFFRDGGPFENLRAKLLPALEKSRCATKRLRIWCAAASTGQECYSVAMTVLEMGLAARGWKIDIVGTDIDTSVLKRASDGRYTKLEVQRGLPIAQLIKYFEQVNADTWKVKPAIRSMLTFRHLNLLGDTSALGQFDIILCRNVLIYFDPATKAQVLARLARNLADDGALLLGGAETVLGITDRFALAPGARGVYVKPACALSLAA